MHAKDMETKRWELLDLRKENISTMMFKEQFKTYLFFRGLLIYTVKHRKIITHAKLKLTINNVVYNHTYLLSYT